MIIVLYVTDSLRPDFLSCYGFEKETSPHIDALAREGALFTNAFAQATWTKPSGASLLSCVYPSVHGVQTMADVLADETVTVPALLKESGFTTVGITTNGYISPAFGFGNGFDEFIELYKISDLAKKRTSYRLNDAPFESSLGLDRGEFPLTTSEDINQSVFAKLREHRGKDLFLFLWSIDTHDPYFHRDTRLARFAAPSDRILWVKETLRMHGKAQIERLKGLYEDMVYFNDYHLGLLMKKLQDLNLFDETLFIVTGDHGEAFSEHGVNSHSGVPFDEQMKVPLIIKFPRSEYGGSKIDALVQHIDIGETILDCTTRKMTDPRFQGTSMLPLLNGAASINDFVFAETQIPKNAFHRFAAIRTPEHKFIDFFPVKDRPPVSIKTAIHHLARIILEGRPKKRLFSLKDDPEERRNLVRRQRDKAEHFSGRIKALAEENAEAARHFKRKKKPVSELDAETAKQLRALGYLE